MLDVLGYLKRFDKGFARGEAAIATVFLLAMIFAASAQALLRNLAGFEVPGANAGLGMIDWVDTFLQRGTLWLAFLGASLATRDGRHIGIDLFPRIAPRKIKLVLRTIAGLGSAVVSFFLAKAFWQAVLVSAAERPSHYEVFVGMSSAHVCDADAVSLADANATAPGFFCGVRGMFDGLGVPVETPESAMELIVPVMFIIITVRLVFNSVDSFIAIFTGHDLPKDQPEGGDDAGSPDGDADAATDTSEDSSEDSEADAKTEATETAPAAKSEAQSEPKKRSKSKKRPRSKKAKAKEAAAKKAAEEKADSTPSEPSTDEPSSKEEEE